MYHTTQHTAATENQMAYDLGPLGQQTSPSAVLILIGAITVAVALFSAARIFLSVLILPGTSLRSFGPKGSWAVITGASDGIGKQYALQLGRAGFNIVLVSRTASKLSTLADELESKSSGITVVSHAMDFGQDKDEDYKALAKVLGGLDGPISILVNNVGLSHSIPVSFADTSATELEQIIIVNCLATLKVSKLVLPLMIPEKRGLVLTMGSFGGVVPTPLLATYSGSKAFLQQWSTALAAELAPQGIMVHFVHSYLVTSAMSKIRRSNWLVPSEKAFVKSVLGKIGRRGGSVGYAYSGSPYWSHALVLGLISGVLGTMNGYVLEYNRKMHVAIRKRALAKAQRDKANGKKIS